MRVRTFLLVAAVVVAALAGPAGATGTADASTGATAATGDVGVAGESSVTGTELECEFPFTATDATGTEVTVQSEPERIVTLNPSAAQTMWEIGGREKVVGVSEYAAYLDGAETRTNISASGQAFVNVEKVIGLKPDLVLAPNTISNDTVAKLRAAGLTVYKFRFQKSIEDIKRKTLLTGQLTGECAGAEETVAWMESELNTVREAIEGVDRPRVLYVFFGYTGGTGTFAHTVIEAAGGTNVAAEANISGYAQISQEVVVEYNPEWIVVNDGATQVPKTAAYNSTYAVENDQIVVLQEEYISQPAPRIVRSVVKLAKALHPEAYERAARTTTEPATATPTAATSTPGAPTATTTPAEAPTTTRAPTTAAPSTPTTTASAGGPGFGVGVAAVALGLALVVVRRPE